MIDLRRALGTLPLLFALMAWGCGTDSGTDAGASDAGDGVDSGGGGTDAGTDAGGGTDAGDGVDAGETTDAGVDGGPGMDAGPGTDAGVDAGPGMDAGPPGMDAGVDAGPAMDAGSDAGADAGPAPITPSIAGDLVITEIMHSLEPLLADDALGEWIEVYNPSTTITYNLNGCSFSDRASRVTDADPTNEFVVAVDLLVPPGAYITVASNGDAPTIGFTPSISHMDAFGLSGNGEDPAFACGGVLIDTVDYDTMHLLHTDRGGPIESGMSIQLIPTALDAISNDTLTNWCGAVDVFHPVPVGSSDAGTGDAGPPDAGLGYQFFGTPGAPNVPCP